MNSPVSIIASGCLKGLPIEFKTVIERTLSEDGEKLLVQAIRDDSVILIEVDDQGDSWGVSTAIAPTDAVITQFRKREQDQRARNVIGALSAPKPPRSAVAVIFLPALGEIPESLAVIHLQAMQRGGSA